MHTNIGMNGFSIIGANDVGTGTVTASGKVTAAQVGGSNGDAMLFDMNAQSQVNVKTIRGVADAIDMTNQNVTVTQLTGTQNPDAGAGNTLLTINATDVVAKGTVTTDVDLLVGRDARFGVNGTGGDIIIQRGSDPTSGTYRGGHVVAPRFVDADAKNYALKPSALTKVAADKGWANPRFSCLMMAYPIKWINCAPSGIQSTRRSPLK